MVNDAVLRAWFCREVLPLEFALTRFIRNNWRSDADITDIRQDIYERVLIGAGRELPTLAGPYIFTVARNVLINRSRHAKVISIELVADLGRVTQATDWLTPARHAEGRELLRQVLAGLELLPPRCREVVRLRKIEGLSTKETARRLGIGVDAVEQQTTLGMRALVDFMLGGSGRIQRPKRPSRRLGKRAS